MYHFSYFKENDLLAIRQFLQRYPFAFLTGSFLSGKQVATQVPVLVEERGGHWFVQGHIMRHTDHHKAFMENPEALLVFTGPSCYVSASWYSNPAIGSTWNYMSVHLAGSIRWMTNDELVAFMQKMTLHFEGGETTSPTVYNNLPDAFLNNMMPAITGFEIKAEKLDNVFKLSQNRDEASYRNIIRQLQAKGGNSALIATEMELRFSLLFTHNKHQPPANSESS